MSIYANNDLPTRTWTHATCFACGFAGIVEKLKDEPTECPCCGMCKLHFHPEGVKDEDIKNQQNCSENY